MHLHGSARVPSDMAIGLRVFFYLLFFCACTRRKGGASKWIKVWIFLLPGEFAVGLQTYFTVGKYRKYFTNQTAELSDLRVPFQGRNWLMSACGNRVVRRRWS